MKEGGRERGERKGRVRKEGGRREENEKHIYSHTHHTLTTLTTLARILTPSYSHLTPHTQVSGGVAGVLVWLYGASTSTDGPKRAL